MANLYVHGISDRLREFAADDRHRGANQNRSQKPLKKRGAAAKEYGKHERPLDVFYVGIREIQEKGQRKQEASYKADDHAIPHHAQRQPQARVMNPQMLVRIPST